MSKNEFICDCHPINEELVVKVRSSLPDAAILNSLADFFSIIGDKTRCRLLFALKEERLCVCDLANLLSMTKSSISHQLGKMRSVGVVRCERVGKQVYYSLDDKHVVDLLELGLTHALHKSKEKVYEK